MTETEDILWWHRLTTSQHFKLLEKYGFERATYKAISVIYQKEHK